tara:strand:+ start:6441 stop:8633 length:2193 start_codon:yes stop_codon:yes gene_type:complete
MAEKIQPNVDTFHGLNNRLSPCSAQYRQGMAYKATNSRINESGIWDKAPSLSAASMGSVVLRGLPVSNTTDHPHFSEQTVDSTQMIVQYLKNDTHVSVGPNKYAYAVDDNLGSSREVYWWDGTDKSTAVTFTTNVAACNYAVAGLVPPAGTILSVGKNATNSLGGRMEIGTYYYMYTYYDEVREVESLPSSVVDWTADAWSGSPESAIYPVVKVTADTDATRLDVNTRVRIYRSKRSYQTGNDINSPNVFYYVGDVQYFKGAGNLGFDFTGGICENKLVGQINDFLGLAAGDTIHLTADGGVVAGNYSIASVASNYSYLCLDADATNLTADGSGITASMEWLYDYTHDTEIENDVYEGRGSRPPSAVDCIAGFDNRMYYFVGNVVYWSSSGRPEEVAQEYTLTYELTNPNGDGTQTTTVPAQPMLTGGLYAEAKYEITELASQTVIGAYPLDGNLWVWTENTTGYLRPTLRNEGVKYVLVRKGVGLVSDKTLSHNPFGLFGADREGVWQITSTRALRRISKGVIDIDDSTKDTYFLQSTLNESFGVWVPVLEEYLWCAVNTGESTVHKQLAYQPSRKIFSGLYEHPSLTGGCTLWSSGGAQAYLTKNTTSGYTLISTTGATLTQTIQFWMGQHSLESVKDNVKIEIIYESITADKNVTINVYQNNVASTTGAQSVAGIVHDDDNLVGKVEPPYSGRMFLVEISIPDVCVAPIIGVAYTANHILWAEKSLR